MTGICRKGEHEKSLQLEGEESLCEHLTFTYACILGVFYGNWYNLAIFHSKWAAGVEEGHEDCVREFKVLKAVI